MSTPPGREVDVTVRTLIRHPENPSRRGTARVILRVSIPDHSWLRWVVGAALRGNGPRW